MQGILTHLGSYSSVNTSSELPTQCTHSNSELECRVLDFTSHGVSDMPESVSRSVNTDVGANAGYWFNTN
jgi:hypothetical protein